MTYVELLYILFMKRSHAVLFIKDRSPSLAVLFKIVAVPMKDHILNSMPSTCWITNLGMKIIQDGNDIVVGVFAIWYSLQPIIAFFLSYVSQYIVRVIFFDA